MKIVDVTEFWSERGGGVRAYLTQLAAEAQVRGHDVTIVAPGARDQRDVLPRGGHVVRLRGPVMPYDPSYHALWNPRAIREAVARERPDVLQVSSPYLAALVATRIRGIALKSFVVHSDFIDTYAHPVLSRVLGAQRADRALSPAWQALRALTARFGVTVCSGRWLANKLEARGCTNVACVPFGIRHDEFSPRLRDEAQRARWLGQAATDARATLIAVVGRLAVEKRIPLVFRALARLAREHPVAVIVLGDGPESPSLKALARALDLSVNFLGFVSDRAVYASALASADVLVHGCAVETFGFSVAEALASGLGVVVPDAGGAGDLATDDAAEVYPREGDAVAIAVATARLLSRPRAERVEAAVAAARRIRSAQAHFDDLFSLYAARMRCTS